MVEARLRAADVLYVAGGNHYHLADAFTSGGFAPLLRELLDEQVYVGESAGSMIFTPHLATGPSAMRDRDQLELLGLDAVTAPVELFDWYLKPHLGSPDSPERTDAWAAERAALLGVPAWFIDDDTALLVRDPDAGPDVVSEGRWLRFGAGGRPVEGGLAS